MLKTYRGSRDERGYPLVTVTATEDGRTWTEELSPAPSLALRSHSPDGFEWGYMGSGPSQLALGILLDATGNAAWSELMYRSFNRDAVCVWAVNDWACTTEELLRWLAGGPAPDGKGGAR